MGRSAIGEPISVQPQESLDALPGFARSADPDTRSSCPAGLVEARVSVELHGVATVSRMWTCASVEDRRGAARQAQAAPHRRVEKVELKDRGWLSSRSAPRTRWAS